MGSLVQTFPLKPRFECSYIEAAEKLFLKPKFKGAGVIKTVKYSAFIAMLALTLVCAKSQSPSQAYGKMVQAAKSKDWEKVYDSFSESSQENMVEGLKAVQAFSEGLFSMMTGEEEQENSSAEKNNEQLSGKEFFVKTMTSGQDNSMIDVGEVKKEKITGDKAVLTIKREKNEDDPRSAFMDDTTEVEMVLENGSWKIVLEQKSGF